MSVTVPILKVKNGNDWDDIPAIKGSKGDDGQDYVLTLQDKSDIAELVYDMFITAESVSV